MDKKYKIAVLSDLKNSLGNTIKSTLSLAKMLDGDITIFHVKKASEVVTEDSNLSAIRSLNSEFITMKNDINRIVTTYSKDFGVTLSCSCAIGNLKNEIASYIEKEKPDFIVLDKRKSGFFNILGDNLIPFVLKKHKGPIFLTDDLNVLDYDNDLSLGVLSDAEEISIADLTRDLLLHSQGPLKSFKILKNNKATVKTETTKERKEVAFEFESNSDSIKNISNYITKNKVNLLCINRFENNNNKERTSLSMPANISDIINNINVPLLLMGQNNYTS
ncbi:universal stress protein [Zobellia uliginosa]|uniref:universal stress protein n=1 Tax=Zobellia uliginosa TaxID=143224 RepID=UPI001C06DEDD|nr:universal stress protein [Zobellia uliginosa]MBU2948458.1 universal stress protein [Zobellia uliginosa]